MKSQEKLLIIGVILAIVGLALILYGNSLNLSIDARIISGRENPGILWMIFGGIALGSSTIVAAAILHAGRCRAVCLFVSIALAGLAADLLTKHWVFQALRMPGEYKADTAPELNAVYWILPNIIGFQTSLNTGALFGFGQGQTTILVTLSLIFLIGIVLYVVLWAWRSLFFSAMLGMITAGICGNLYDRLGWHGLTYPDWHPMTGQQIYAVRDWILVMIGTFPWPNFNVADSLLVCSIILWFLHNLYYEWYQVLKGRTQIPCHERLLPPSQRESGAEEDSVGLSS